MSDAAEKILNEERGFTYADYKSWELDKGKPQVLPGERYELIGGTAYAMAAPNDRHQAILGELVAQMGTYLRGKPCKVRAAPYDVRLFYEEDESDDTVVQPDISVICDEQKRGDEGCRGAPDLVVEILSPSNTSDDYVRKFNLYLKAGVREYWIVDPKTETAQVFVLRDGAYVGRVYGPASPLFSAVIDGLSVTLRDVFAG